MNYYIRKWSNSNFDQKNMQINELTKSIEDHKQMIDM